MDWIRRYGLYLAWLVSLVAVGGSLYFSEIAGFVPCKLCWVQRIFMYPLAILLGIASYREDRSIVSYVLPFSVTGGLVSLFHYLEQKIPAVANWAPCTVGVPCNGQYINWLGFITIPFLALTAFVMISVLMWLSRGEETD
ncbi:disulfide bond formation protein C [Marinithermofilum abyssi]|uniref:Disulfide bond formation protein C n=1 Tax=Marinithermofilum abyssi TaxID=1571185 RepID=A0A8J2VDB3_9BACL|nr:disulfide oxidoreductase [Marinithermofilum abyssi]GGE07472.1 disulfide bond formation protein C [Marinithermofilum abyssi]